MNKIAVLNVPDNVLEENISLVDEEPLDLDDLIRNWIKVAHDFKKLDEKELKNESCEIVQSLIQIRTGQPFTSNCQG